MNVTAEWEYTKQEKQAGDLNGSYSCSDFCSSCYGSCFARGPRVQGTTSQNPKRTPRAARGMTWGEE